MCATRLWRIVPTGFFVAGRLTPYRSTGCLAPPHWRALLPAPMLLAVMAVSAAAQPAAAPKWGSLERAIGKEDYTEAKKLADGIVQRGTPDDRAKVMAVYARILLGLHQPDQARQYLAMQMKQGAAPPQMVAYAAWLAALDGKPDEAVETLEKAIQQAGDSPDEAVAEAADVLAMLHMARGQTDKAKKTVDFGLKVLQYRGVKDGYVLALLRGRLASNVTAGEAKRLYDQAEKLRKEQKYQQAGQLYARVHSVYPGDPYGHASGFRIGQCYAGLNRTAQAVDWWRKFIDQSPAGPWRGQARVAMIDAALEPQLDLATAVEHAMAANAVLEKPLDPAAEPSWTSAAHDVHLRYGIVSLAEGRFDAAAHAFGQARQAAPKGATDELLAGLDRLIALAGSRRRLTPEELSAGDPRAVSTLALGGIYNLLGWHERARGFFTMVISGPTRSNSAAHRAYARLGLARALLPAAGTDPVKLAHVAATYESGVKEHPQGAWHDETLRELALLCEHAAAVQFAPPSRKEAGEQPPPAPVSDAERQQRAKSLRTARARALPHWAALAARYPASPHAPQALYHAGALYTEAERPEEAVASFERLVTAHPASPWAGDAHVHLIDVKLERQFDLPGAAHHARAAVAWYAGRSREPSGIEAAAANGSGSQRTPPNTSPLPLGEGSGVRASATASGGTEPAPATLTDGTGPVPSTLGESGYAIFLRAGLVAYLMERAEEAAGFFEQAGPVQPERGFVVVHGEIPTGIERLLAVARSNRQLTPELVRQGDPKAKLILMLADVFLESSVHEKALELATAVIDKPKGAATAAQRSWAHRQRAVAYGHLGWESKEAARREYMAAQQAGPTTPWAPECLLLAGTILHNHETRRQEAIAVFEDVVRRYPASESSAKAAYFVGVLHEWNSEWRQAKAAYQRVVRDYPQSRWASAAMNYHLKKVDAALAAQETGR